MPFYSQTPDYTALLARMVRCKSYFSSPLSLSLCTIGTTELRRPIPAYLLGSRKKQTLFVGGVHALEQLTVLVCLRFVEDLLYHRDTPEGELLAQALEECGLIVVPCLNIDGMEMQKKGSAAALEYQDMVDYVSHYDISTWQANARGVDLNHNYAAGYTRLKEQEIAAGICGPSPTRYGGERAESERETQAIVSLCRRHSIRQLYAFHSQGEEIYYRYGIHTPRCSRAMGEKLAEACGYTLCDPEGMASHGGMKDWFIETFHRPAFTFEIGRGKNPLPVSDFPVLYRKVLPALQQAVLFGQEV